MGSWDGEQVVDGNQGRHDQSPCLAKQGDVAAVADETGTDLPEFIHLRAETLR